MENRTAFRLANICRALVPNSQRDTGFPGSSTARPVFDRALSTNFQFIGFGVQIFNRSTLDPRDTQCRIGDFSQNRVQIETLTSRPGSL